MFGFLLHLVDRSLFIQGKDIQKIIDEAKGVLLFVFSGHCFLNKLEDDDFEIQMIYCGRLNFTSELDVILLILIMRELGKPGQVNLGGVVLGLDLVIHFFKSGDYKFENFMFFLIIDILLADDEAVS